MFADAPLQLCPGTDLDSVLSDGLLRRQRAGSAARRRAAPTPDHPASAGGGARVQDMQLGDNEAHFQELMKKVADADEPASAPPLGARPLGARPLGAGGQMAAAPQAAAANAAADAAAAGAPGAWPGRWPPERAGQVAAELEPQPQAQPPASQAGGLAALGVRLLAGPPVARRGRGSAPPASQAGGLAALGAMPAQPRATTSSRYNGVYWSKQKQRWQASINFGGKYLYLGSFRREEDTARAFDLAALKLRGTHSSTKVNFDVATYLDTAGEVVADEALDAIIAKHASKAAGTGPRAAATGMKRKRDDSLPGATGDPLRASVGAAAAAAAVPQQERAATEQARRARVQLGDVASDGLQVAASEALDAEQHRLKRSEQEERPMAAVTGPAAGLRSRSVKPDILEALSAWCPAYAGNRNLYGVTPGDIDAVLLQLSLVPREGGRAPPAAAALPGGEGGEAGVGESALNCAASSDRRVMCWAGDRMAGEACLPSPAQVLDSPAHAGQAGAAREEPASAPPGSGSAASPGGGGCTGGEPAAASGGDGPCSSPTAARVSSKFRGLCWDKKHRAWRVRIFYQGKQRHVGRFKSDTAAARAYDKAAVYLYGAKAILNFSLEETLADPLEVSSFIAAAKGAAAAAGSSSPPRGGAAGGGHGPAAAQRAAAPTGAGARPVGWAAGAPARPCVLASWQQHAGVVAGGGLAHDWLLAQLQQPAPATAAPDVGAAALQRAVPGSGVYVSSACSSPGQGLPLAAACAAGSPIGGAAQHLPLLPLQGRQLVLLQAPPLPGSADGAGMAALAGGQQQLQAHQLACGSAALPAPACCPAAAAAEPQLLAHQLAWASAAFPLGPAASASMQLHVPPAGLQQAYAFDAPASVPSSCGAVFDLQACSVILDPWSPHRWG
ncbi:CRL5 [Scenedesmus sp. PABB004]|nr:CRL5 [Scenedesmus sp. PABB004]